MDNFMPSIQLAPPGPDEGAAAADPIQKVHTSCKNCLFAKYNGKTQSSCLLGRIENYKLQDPTSILETYSVDEKGDEVEFFIVNGRLCNCYRDKGGEWAAKFKNKLDAALDAVTKESYLKIAVLVYLDSQATPERIKATTESLLNQLIRPFQIFFVNNQDGLRPGEIAALVMSVLGNDITWRITNVLERTFSGEEGWHRVGRERALDLAISALPNPTTSKVPCATYYALFNAGFVVPDDFIDDVDYQLNEKMRRFRLLTPLQDGNGLVCQVYMHQHPEIGGVWHGEDGSMITDIVEKIVLLSEAQNVPHFYDKVTNVCPSLLSPQSFHVITTVYGSTTLSSLLPDKTTPTSESSS